MKVAVISVGATGHVLPTLPIVTELVRRGVDVTYFTSANFEKTITRTGARFSPVATVLTNQGEAKDDIEKDMMAELPLRFLSEAESTIDQILPVLEREPPDVILCDALALAGRLAASALNLPRVQIFTSYAANEHFSVARHFPPVPDEHPARQAAHRLADTFTEKYGVPHMDIFEIFEGAGEMNLVLIQRAFHPAGDTFDDRFVFVGAQVGERDNSGTWTAPDDGLPVVYSSLGTLFNVWPEFYVMLAQAVRGLPLHMVSAIGTVIQPESLGELPENMTVAPFLPQLDILQKASAFITHAGTGSVMEAVYFGVPMLGIPQMDEQIATAMRMQELGLGKAIPNKALVTPELLRASLLELLENKQYAQTLATFQADMLASGGYRQAAQSIIDFVDARCAPVASDQG